MRCRICNAVGDPTLEDTLSRLTNKRFYPDLDNPNAYQGVCTECGEEVYGDNLERIAAEEQEVGLDVALDEQTEAEVQEYLNVLDKED